jgi:hypothetical protein
MIATLRPALLLLALASLSCGSDSKETICTPGATQVCVCPGGASGAQACDKDGKSWGTCYGCPSTKDSGAVADAAPLADRRIDGTSSAGCTKAADLLDLKACGGGKSCGVIDSTGKLGCMTPGSTALLQPCSDTSACVAGSGCFGLSGSALSCLAFCQAGGDPCAKGSACTGTFKTSGGTIGLCLATASCDIVTGIGCSGTNGCYIGDTAGNPVCVPAGTAVEGGTCSTADQCLPGLVCKLTICRQLCHTGTTCTNKSTTCQGVGVIFSAAPTVGICLP